jgi:Ca-activated chloride channel family protein
MKSKVRYAWTIIEKGVNIMKKSFITILSVVLAVALFCSCSAAPSPEPFYSEAPAPDGYAEAPAAPAAEAPAEGGGYDTAPEAGMEQGYHGSAEHYIPIEDNNPKPTDTDSLVTFSLKVDTASYNNVQRYIEGGSLPPQDAVKVEEMVNYFNYESPVEYDGHPLGIYTEIGKNPLDPSKYMAFIRVKAAEADKSQLPPSSLTFLIDTSGSMDTYDKLPLLKEAFGLLTENLGPDDVVSIVTYAGNSAVILDGARGDESGRILDSIYNLSAGGSTAGEQGIQAAYRIAEKNFIPGGNNRVILATDGDFNVGVSSIEGLSQLISGKRDSGIYLSTLGFGTETCRTA